MLTKLLRAFEGDSHQYNPVSRTLIVVMKQPEEVGRPQVPQRCSLSFALEVAL